MNLKKWPMLVPYLLQGVGGVPQLNQHDRIHPTLEGQRIIAENVWKILRMKFSIKIPNVI